MFDLTGKTAFVTGGGSGIGEATAHALASCGAYVHVADLNAEAAAKCVSAINGSGGSATPVELNVADPSAVEVAARALIANNGPIDILVNNAGIGHVGTLLQTDLEDLDRVLDVNVRGVFNVTKAFLPAMIEAGGGSIVNIASIGGVIAIRDRLAYCTSKFAVVGFTKAVALDHAGQGIRANAVCPGRVETPFVRQRLAEYPDPEAAYREMSSTQAVGRMARPEEIAAAVVYLAADESAFVTGTALEIDGGWAVGK